MSPRRHRMTATRANSDCSGMRTWPPQRHITVVISIKLMRKK
jgi:hypothetical protein